VQHANGTLHVSVEYRLLDITMLGTFVNIAIFDDFNEAAITQGLLLQLSTEVEKNIGATGG